MHIAIQQWRRTTLETCLIRNTNRIHQCWHSIPLRPNKFKLAVFLLRGQPPSSQHRFFLRARWLDGRNDIPQHTSDGAYRFVPRIERLSVADRTSISRGSNVYRTVRRAIDPVSGHDQRAVPTPGRVTPRAVICPVSWCRARGVSFRSGTEGVRWWGIHNRFDYYRSRTACTVTRSYYASGGF